jgi:hypothetical protein
MTKNLKIKLRMTGVREHIGDRDLPDRRHESITLDSDTLSVL